jgi:hypothetical protein
VTYLSASALRLTHSAGKRSVTSSGRVEQEPQEMSLHDSNSTREINGRPIHWKDKAGVVHAAEGNWLTPRDFCLWTVCGSADVPANTGYHPGDGDKVTCEACLSKQ